MDNGCGGEQQHYNNNNNNNNNERGQNGNNINFLWDFREVGTCRFDWSNPLNDDTRTTTTASTAAAHAFMFSHTGDNAHHQSQHPTLYSAVGGGGGGGGGSHVHPDPHLTCLKLGKRHYFEDTSVSGGGLGGGPHVSGFPIGKRGRSFIGVGGSSSSSSLLGSSTVPRCQVEGCHVALLNAKDYHRRHKVCEMHSKAPKVVVLGIEQRFCQQCSRFHVVSEFDDSKRSCRRRLAGHNERRRKSSNDSLSRNLSQDSRSMGERYPCISSPAGGALSLLSSKTISWVSPSDLSSRSSAALRELIAENRASILARQLFYDQGWPHHPIDEMGSSQSAGFISHLTHQHQMFPDPSNCDRFHESGAQVTVDLMQEPSSAFLTGKSKSKEEEEDCCELWRSLEGTYVV